jgi:hypothetical protein
MSPAARFQVRTGRSTGSLCVLRAQIYLACAFVLWPDYLESESPMAKSLGAWARACNNDVVATSQNRAPPTSMSLNVQRARFSFPKT